MLLPNTGIVYICGMQQGIVIKSTGSWYQVRLTNGEVWQCRIIGKFRTEDKRLTNPVAVGDIVQVEAVANETGVGVIRSITPRRNFVVRQSPRKKHALHLLASNIDQAMLVVTIAHPMLKQGFIDRFLLMTEPFSIPTIIVFNKIDLYNEEDMEVLQALQSIYEDIGYETLRSSALTGLGREALKAKLKDKTTLIAGQSGVGKSTLINSLVEGLNLRTGELSEASGKGQHTTTFAEMHSLPFGGQLIDTPGIKTLSFNYLAPIDIAHNFREFFAVSENCRFGGNCMHRNEPGCAVKEGLENGELSELRYLNYLTLLEEAEEQNYWERRKV